MYLVFSYFDKIKGPEIFFSLPKDIPMNIRNTVMGIFDSNIENPFFEYVLEDQKIINLNFELPSPWARGNAEMVMISVISEKDMKSEHFYDILKEVSDKIKSKMDIYKSFYIEEDYSEKDDDINKKYIELKQIFNEGLEKLENKIKEIKIMELVASRDLSLAGAHKVFGSLITDMISCILQLKPLILYGDIDASNALFTIFNRIFLDIISLNDKIIIEKEYTKSSPEALVINTKLGLIDNGIISDEAHDAINRYLNEAEKTGNDDAAIILLRQKLSVLMKVADFLKEFLIEKKSEKHVIKDVKSHLRIKVKNDELYAVRLILKARGDETLANQIIISKFSKF